MQIFHKLQLIPNDYKSILCSNKITNHSSQLLKKIQSKPNIINNQFFNHNKNQTQQQKKLIKNPFKKTFIQFFKRSKSHTIHNDNNNNFLYDKLLIKRTFGTAPLRNRIKTQINKQNVLNCQQLIERKITQKSLSTVFNVNRQSKINQKKSKPNIIYSSSKLPKDFFTKSTHINEYIESIKKQSQQNQNLYEYLNHINHDINTSEKISSCTKIPSSLNKNQSKLKIKTQTAIDDQVFSFSNQSSNNSKKLIETQEQFTFRKSSKNIQEKTNTIKNIHNSSSSKFYKQIHQMTFLDKQDKTKNFSENNDFLKVSPVNFYQAEGKRKTSNVNKHKRPSQLLKL